MYATLHWANTSVTVWVEQATRMSDFVVKLLRLFFFVCVGQLNLTDYYFTTCNNWADLLDSN